MIKKDPRYKAIKKLKDNRYTYDYIGKKYGITRQRVWQILKGYTGKQD